MNLRLKFHTSKLKILAGFLCFTYVTFLLYSQSTWHINRLLNVDNSRKLPLYKVYIIGKAAIAQYLWQHLFNGHIEYSENGFYQNGNRTFDNINFIYLSGPGYIQNSVPQDIEFLVLILNGRSIDKILKAKEWLDYLYYISSLKKVAVILLGDERCLNNWIIKYLKSKGGIIDVLFIVYDAALVDDEEVFQWPLGVATYRGFPNIGGGNVKNIEKRRYKCNFLGTVYKNSSREILNSVLRNASFRNICYVLTREQWVPKETYSSLQNYIDVVQDSDLTLSPVGINSECYRIYEAMSLGSIPIVEDAMTQGECVSPLRLLKKYNAPLIYVKDWNKLSEIVSSDQALNASFILHRRRNILKWYHEFKMSVAVHFVKILNQKFFYL